MVPFSGLIYVQFKNPLPRVPELCFENITVRSTQLWYFSNLNIPTTIQIISISPQSYLSGTPRFEESSKFVEENN